MAKVYTLVREVVGLIPHIYVPIKHSINPHNGNPAFCADLPNFFGGTIPHTAGSDLPSEIQKIDTLNNELQEESQQRLVIVPPLANPVQNEIYYGGFDGQPYFFYVQGGINPGINFMATGHLGIEILALQAQPAAPPLPQGWTNAWYEHRYILKIPNTAFVPIGGVAGGGQQTRDTQGLINLCNAAIIASGNPVPPGLAVASAAGNVGALVGTQTLVAFDHYLPNF